MEVLAAAGAKGGPGKSTLAINLAVEAAAAGRRALLVDADPQRTASGWYQDRKADTLRLVEALSPKDLDEAINRAGAAGYDLVVIDTAGRDDAGTAAAVRVASLVLMPCRPTVPDMRATAASVETVRRIGTRFALVISQAPPGRKSMPSSRTREARKGLGILGTVAPVALSTRNDYQDAFASGQGVRKYAPEGRATEEVAALWIWASSHLGKATAIASVGERSK